MFTLFGRSVMVLALLFGLLFAVLMVVSTAYDLPWTFALLSAIGVVLLQYVLGPYVIQWIFKIRWTPVSQVNPRLARFIEDSCRRLRIPPPRFGLIVDGNPNAFTFGHYPRDARLVITQGLIDMLNEEEQEAVVAHELGHIAHWDFVVMTLAMVVPLVMYTVFRIGGSVKKSDSDSKGAGYLALVAAAAYVAYVLSQYIVLLLSRIREYYADQFSAQETRNPRALGTALAKIAYGLARAPRQKEEKQDLLGAQAGKALGIFDPATAGALALAAAGTSPSGISPQRVVEAMRWDLWNPWALVYQLNSSHPLPAHRLRALEILSRNIGQAPAYDFPERQPESYWDEFTIDLGVVALPYLGIALGLVAATAMVSAGTPWTSAAGAVLLGLGLGYLVKIRRAYPTEPTPERQIASLLGEVKVSGVRCIPCRVQGKIIGRGVPGLFYSEDLVLQDESGFITLDYRQPLGFLEFLFGVFRAQEFVGKDVVAVGWYRRRPSPSLELRYLIPREGPMQRTYAYPAKLAIGTVLTVLGIVYLLPFLMR